MSLLEMVQNFDLFAFVQTFDVLDYVIGIARGGSAASRGPIDDTQRALIQNNLTWVSKECARRRLDRSNDRLIHLAHSWRNPMLRYDELLNQLTVLRDAILDDIKLEYLYHYPRDKISIFCSRGIDWAAAFQKFTSARADIDAGIDCYALGYNTASVFYMMRVAELGMRALARERGVKFPDKPLEWANWQPILEQTEARAKAATKGMSVGPGKDAALAFYSGAVAQLHGFKDTFRNVTMHVRKNYDDLDALRAINQVRDFMNALSEKIGEKTRKPIRRWP
jgi:hypothetical protein